MRATARRANGLRRYLHVRGLVVLLAIAGVWAVSLEGRAVPAGTDGAVSEGDASTPRVDWNWSIEVDTGGGHVGPWRMNRSDWRYVDDPSVALGAEGEAGVVWVDQARKDVLFQRYGPRGEARLAEPVNVSRSPAIFSWLPRIVLPPGEPDTVYVLWQEIVFSGGTHGGEIFFARSADGGRSFGTPINLSRSEAGDGKGRLTEDYWHNGSLDLALGPDGTLYAAWTEYEGALRLARSTDGGRTFTEPRRVAGGPDRLPARGPSLAVGPDGVVHLAWTVGGDPDADIRHARSTDGGMTFGETRRVASGPGHADAPKLARDRDGTLHLVYANSPGGPLGRYDVFYTRSANGESFGRPRRISTPLPEGFVGAGFPDLAISGEGDLYVLCELFPDETQRSFGLALVTSRDGGDRFTAPAIVPGTVDSSAGLNGSLQGLLMRKLDTNHQGAIAVVNSTIELGESSRIRLYHGQEAKPRSLADAGR